MVKEFNLEKGVVKNFISKRVIWSLVITTSFLQGCVDDNLHSRSNSHNHSSMRHEQHPDAHNQHDTSHNQGSHTSQDSKHNSEHDSKNDRIGCNSYFEYYSGCGGCYNSD